MNEVIVKRVSAELSGNMAVLSDVTEAKMRLTDMKKKDRDQVMTELGLEAIDLLMKMYEKEQGNPYPTISELKLFIQAQARTEVHHG